MKNFAPQKKKKKKKRKHETKQRTPHHDYAKLWIVKKDK
jgi:hypothetical protein